jgi:hypothetical protein
VLGYPGLLYLKIERRSRESLVRDRGIALWLPHRQRSSCWRMLLECGGVGEKFQDDMKMVESSGNCSYWAEVCCWQVHWRYLWVWVGGCIFFLLRVRKKSTLHREAASSKFCFPIKETHGWCLGWLPTYKLRKRISIFPLQHYPLTWITWPTGSFTNLSSSSKLQGRSFDFSRNLRILSNRIKYFVESSRSQTSSLDSGVCRE